jgi:MYXO-CTERM domain-containing protein
MSNASGRGAPQYYTTIQIADVNGDGKADVCGRGAAGFECWLSSGTAFSSTITSTEFSDASGGSASKYYGTIQLADVNGDGMADVCGRAAAGFLCFLSEGTKFGAEVSTDEYSDSRGFDTPEYYTTLQMGDLDGDGKADVCGRGAAGISGRLSSGTAFGTVVAGPTLSDTSGWDGVQYYETISLVGSLGGKEKAPVDGGREDASGLKDAEAEGDVSGVKDAEARSDARATRDSSADAPGRTLDDATSSSGNEAGDASVGSGGGCSCRAARTDETGRSPVTALLVVLALLATRRPTTPRSMSWRRRISSVIALGLIVGRTSSCGRLFTTTVADAATACRADAGRGCSGGDRGAAATHGDARVSAADTERPADTGSADATATGCPELADTDPWKDRLGAHTLAERGAILGCAHQGSRSPSHEIWA